MRWRKYFICTLVNTEKVFSPARYGFALHIEDIGFFSGPHYDDYYDIYKCLHVFLWRYELYIGFNYHWRDNLRQRS